MIVYLGWVACLLLAAGLVLCWISLKYRTFQGLGFPILGNLYHAVNNISFSYTKIIDNIVDNHRKFGETMCIWLGPFPCISTADPVIMEELSANPHFLNKPSFAYGIFKDVFEGAFSSTAADDKWRRFRKAMVSSVNKVQLQIYHEVFIRRSKELLDTIAAKKGHFDIHPLVMLSTLDTVMETLCGLRKDTLKKGNFLVQELILRLAEKVTNGLLVQCLTRVDISDLDKLSNFFFSECTKDILENNNKVATDLGYEPMIQKIVPDKIRNRENKLLISKAVAELIIEAEYTSSICISGALLFLAMHPEYQEKVVDEQKEIFGDSLADPTPSDIKKMHYLEMVLKETARLSSAPLTFKESSKDIQIGPYIFPEKSTVIMCWHRLRRNPKYYKHPDRFYPDHFLPEQVASRPKAAYFSFSSGPRRCPGEQYFLNMTKVLLSIILRRLKFSTPLKFEDVSYQAGPFMQLNGPHTVFAEPRHNTSAE